MNISVQRAFILGLMPRRAVDIDGKVLYAVGGKPTDNKVVKAQGKGQHKAGYYSGHYVGYYHLAQGRHGGAAKVQRCLIKQV